MVRCILAFLRERGAQLDDPRSAEEALKGSKLGEFWKYHEKRCKVENMLRGITVESPDTNMNKTVDFSISKKTDLLGSYSIVYDFSIREEDCQVHVVAHAVQQWGAFP